MPFGTNDKVYVEPFGKSDAVHPDSQGQYQQMYGVIPGQEDEEERVRKLKLKRDTESLLDKQLRKGQGQVEAMLSTGTGIAAMFNAIPAAAVKRALGMVPDVEKETARLMQEKTFQPRTEEGKDYTDLIGKGFNELAALGPGNLSGLAHPRPIGALRKEPVKPVNAIADVLGKEGDKGLKSTDSAQARIDALQEPVLKPDAPLGPWDTVVRDLGGEVTPPRTPFTGMVDQLTGRPGPGEPAFKMAPEEKPYVKTKEEAARDDALAARLEAAVNRQNPTRDTMQVTPEGQGIAPNDLGTLTALKRQLDAEAARIEAQQQALASQQASHLNAVEVLQQREKLRAAQEAIEARQAALELEVKRQATQDFNAAERARQEAAPTGYAQWVEQQRMAAEQRRPGDNTPLEFTKENAPYSLADSPRSIDGLDFTQHRAEMLARGIDKLEDINKAWDIRRTEQLTEDTIQRLKDEKLLGQEPHLVSLEQSLREGAHKPTGNGQGPKTRNAIALRSQRGQSQMLADLSQAIVDLGKKFASLRRETSPNTDFVSKLPGLRKEADALVTKPTPSKDLLEQARSEGDGPPMFKDWQSGLSLAAQKAKSTVLTNTAQHFNYAVNRGNYIIRQAVYPLERAFARLSGPRLVDLMSIIHSEMFGRKEFTPEQLAKITSDKDILKTRDAFKKVWDVIYEETKARYEAMGKTPPTKLEAYMSSVFKGDYHVPVYDKKGKLVWYVQTPTKGTAKEAIAWIKNHFKDHPDVDVSKMVYDHDKMYQPGGKFGNAPRDVLASWKDIAEALGDSPLSAEFKQAMEEWVANKGTHAFRQDLHHVEKKANVRGFEGDQPWLSETQNAHAWAKAQIENMQTAIRWATTQEAIANVKEFVTDPVIQDNQPNNIALTKAYMYDHMGVNQNLMRQFENWVAGSAGLSRSHVKMISDVFKTGLYIKTLFGSLPYAMATPIQALNGSFGWFAKEFGEGNAKVKPIQFMKDLVDSALGEHIPLTGTKIPKLSADSNAKLKWAEDNGYIHNLLHEEGASIGAHKAVDAAQDFANKTIAAPDNWTRRVVFLPFANALEASGKFPTKEAAWTRAGEITDAIAVSMRQQDRPLFFKKLGVLGDNLWTFHAPLVSQWNNMFALKKYGDRTGNYKPLGVMLGTLLLVGGVFSMPGSKEASFVMDKFKDIMASVMPENYSTWDPKVALLKMLPDIKIMGNTPGEIASFGLGSVAYNADMRSRMSNEIIDAEKPISSMLPGVGVYGDMLGSIGKTMAKPNENTFAQLAKDMSPGPTIRGLMETTMPQFKSVDQQGAEHGITSYRNPHDVDDPSAFVRRTPMETVYKGMGLTRLSEAVRREKDARWNQEWGPGGRVEKAKNNIVEGIFKDIANGRVEDAKLSKGVKKYVELGGDTKALQATLQTKLKDMNFTKMENGMMKAKSYGKVMGLLERMNMDQSVPQ